MFVNALVESGKDFQASLAILPIFSLLERFVVIMYNKSSNLESVNKTRMELFCHRNKIFHLLFFKDYYYTKPA